MNSPKGSQWRKWDLHVHTPFSYTNAFSEWVDYVSKLKEKAVAHDISVMGVTDYFSVDGYEKLLTECEEGTRNECPRIPLSNGKHLYLIPIIELRLDNFTGNDNSVNLHIAFSPKLLPSTIRDSFLENLPIRYQDKTLKCKASDLIKIGDAEENMGSFNANLNIGALSEVETNRKIEKAFACITFSSGTFEENLDAFKKLMVQSGIKKDTYLLLIANKGHGGLSDFRWTDVTGNTSRSGIIRQNLLNLADICFSNSERDKAFLLGDDPGTSKSEVIKRFRTLKPCIWGSDAHNADSLFHPSNGNSRDYTWIKADTSFDGLKQILYEPEKRVVISENNPEDRSKKVCIAKISFNNSNGFPIQNQNLEINRDLVCIVGGRGSGKSALFETIAFCFDQHKSNTYDSGKTFDSGYAYDKKTFIDHYKSKAEIDVDIALTFTDKDNNELQRYNSRLQQRGNVCSYPFQYLGQNQIEFYADNPEEIHRIAFDTILKQTSQSGELFSFQAKIEQKKQDLIDFNKEIERLRISIASYDEKKLDEDKKRLESELNLLSSKDTRDIIDGFNKSRVNRENLNKVEDLIGKIDVDSPIPSFGTLGKALTAIEAFEREITPIIAQANQLANQLNPDAKTITWTNLDSLRNEIAGLKSTINKAGILKEYGEALSLIENQLKGKTDISVSYLESQKNSETEIRTKLEELQKLKVSLAGKETERESISNTLHQLYTDYEQSYAKAIEEFNSKNSLILKGIKMEARKVFLIGKLVNLLWNLTDGRKSKDQKYFKESWMQVEDDSAFDLVNWYQGFLTNEENHKVFLSFDRNQIDSVVFSDFNSLETEISYEVEDGEFKPIYQLSLGQKGTVLLKFYLSSGNDCPILIDQPEDHLDNDFIYRDLVKTIRNTKEKRQIIIVTHDANLVVNGDAEQVIVAKYKDQRISHSLSGALENPNIRVAVTTILEGGAEAFKKREMKYQFDN